MEYDREGYRYDGKPGLFQSGANPSPETGDYYSFNPATGLVDANNTAAWRNNGVAEVDCLMCHLNTDTSGFRYSNLERNLTFVGPKKPVLAATMGLVSPGTTKGVVGIPTKGANETMPVLSPFTYLDIGAGNGTIPGSLIEKTPDKENCALCHFADKSLVSAKGPAGIPLGFTTFQKYMAPGTTADGDNATNPSAKNAEEWTIAKGRAEFGKRAESINDPANHDVHMDASSGNMTCSDCHYTLGSSDSSPVQYQALMDGNTTIQPVVDVFKIDHQFAKGNDKPDGKNMDQIDNTITCEACHISGNHPNIPKDAYGAAVLNANGNYDLTLTSGATVEVPVPWQAHSNMPAFHTTMIDCRTCHIPELNFVKKQLVADYLVGPYRTGPRGQFKKSPTGIHYKPLYVWMARNHEATFTQIVPVTPEVNAVWVDGDPLHPTFQRLGKKAAENFRTLSGDLDGDGWYDFSLNHPQGNGTRTDTALIVNTSNEITQMVNQLAGMGVTTPKMNLYVTAFTVSHNVKPIADNMTLGSPKQGGGCVMCHSSSNPADSDYSAFSVGFFDKQHLMFNNPNDDNGTPGNPGLKQTDVGGTLRILYSFCDVNASTLSDGDNVPNTVDQAACLGYNATQVGYYTSAGTAGTAKPSAWFSWVQKIYSPGFESGDNSSTPDHVDTSAMRQDTNVTQTVIFDASASICPSGNCTYYWDFENNGAFVAGSVVQEHYYAVNGTHDATLRVLDNVSGLSDTVTNMTWTYHTPFQVDVQKANTPPTAGFNSSVAPDANGTIILNVGQSLVLTDSSTDSESTSGLTFRVMWGDEYESSGNAGGAVSHSYSNTGTYKIRYFAVDGGGLEAKKASDTKVVVLQP